MHADDAKLITRAKANDDDAFEMLVLRYEANVLHYLIRFIGTRHDALDVSQEVWIRVHRSLSRFKDGGSFKAWLFRIARNCAISFFRSRGREPERVCLEDAQLATPAAEHRQDSNTIFWRRVRHSVGERAASALWMHYAEGMQMDEIAPALGMRAGAVKVMMHRSRKKLRSVLGEARQEALSDETTQRPSGNLEVDYVC